MAMAMVTIGGDAGPLEASLARGGSAVDAFAEKLGTAISEGADKAGRSLQFLGDKAKSFGVPFAEGLGKAGASFDKFGTEASDVSKKVQAAIQRTQDAQAKYAEVVKTTTDMMIAANERVASEQSAAADAMIAANAKVAESVQALADIEAKVRAQPGSLYKTDALGRSPARDKEAAEAAVVAAEVEARQTQTTGNRRISAAKASEGQVTEYAPRAVGAAAEDVLLAGAAEKRAQSVDKLKNSFASLGKVSLIGLSVGAAAVGTEAVKLGVQFENATAKMAGTTGENEATLKKLQGDFEQTAGTFQSSG